jgi:hypothetical protein
MKRERQKVYMVQLIGWYYNDEQDLPSGAKLLKAFRSREAAEAHARSLDIRIDPNSGENPFPVVIRQNGRPLGEQEPYLLAMLDECGLPHPPRPLHVVASGHDWADADWWRGCHEQLISSAESQAGAFWQFWGLFQHDGTDHFEVVETYLD